MSMSILAALNSIIFAILFMMPGIMISWSICRNESDQNVSLKHLVFGICFSASLFTFASFINSRLSIDSAFMGIMEYIGIIACISIVLYRKKIAPTFAIAKDVAYVLCATVIGVMWKLMFVWPIRTIGSAYDYASIFSKGSVPDLGFYTGMAVDHANYSIGMQNPFWAAMQDALVNPGFNISLFLITFAYLGFIYMLCIQYSSNRMYALCAMLIMAMGPFEIFYTSTSVFGHPLAYLAVFSLFFMHARDSEHGQRRLLAIFLCLAMAVTYYTSTIANIITCMGFCIAILLEKTLVDRKTALRSSLADKRLRGFAAIAIISASVFIVVSSNMLDFTHDMIQDTTSIRAASNLSSHSTTTVFVGTETLRPYRDPALFGISAIRAEGILFVIIGLISLIAYCMRPRSVQKSIRSFKEHPVAMMIFAIIPASLTSFAFIYAGYPARAFDYFGFFAILMLAVMSSETLSTSQSDSAANVINATSRRRRHVLTLVWISITILVAALSLLTMRDKRIYFDISDGEIIGATWIADNLRGKVLSDQAFVSRLVLNGYYNVTGTSDTDPRLTALFYQHDKQKFLDAARSDLEIEYLVTTKRMRESHILMLDIPQVAIQNSDLIDSILRKVYDNGDVRVYSLDKANTHSSMPK